MRILSTYCPHCDANVLTTCTPEGETLIGRRWVPAVVVRCPVGHPIIRLGAVGGPDRVLDLLLDAMEEAQADPLVHPSCAA